MSVISCIAIAPGLVKAAADDFSVNKATALGAVPVPGTELANAYINQKNPEKFSFGNTALNSLLVGGTAALGAVGGGGIGALLGSLTNQGDPSKNRNAIALGTLLGMLPGAAVGRELGSHWRARAKEGQEPLDYKERKRLEREALLNNAIAVVQGLRKNR